MKYNYPNSPYSQYAHAIEALDKEYEEKRNTLRATLREAQDKCKHNNTTYYPDASGNNDSFTECDECGKEI